ncbi:MAG: ATP-binding cassette domain-containing protein [Methyloceanibacter sp.]|uniref:ATP-binding cassette domain-containing protein n=1 Tax=Methyloceanibacter sp. TaxID=1965321 RepID=UPI001D38F059|nr:ATP-binding cassette domain-containing protein [Methyloceanibacter sp.]MCB1442224.1 ATP-binding cassette domain-containing protein [Methyloceanibacter sp.]
MNDTQRAGATSPFKIRIEEKTHIGADGTRLTAIRDLSLDLKPESMTVLMGPSGCGKTTLLRVVAGLDDDFTGEIDMPAHSRLGFMFQEPRLLPWRTVRQNIELVAAPGFSGNDLENLAEAVGVAEMLSRYPQELSLGLARRAALARAFSTEPDLLLLDEPFVSLDERTADRLRRLLLDVWSARPTTAVMVTHNPREALLLADQLVLLAPRPTHVVAVETIDMPQAERDTKMIEVLHADLSRRFPANFAEL